MADSSLRDQSAGRWFDILCALGIDRKFLRNKHGPCPICNAGRDRFRWDNKQGNGTFFCSQCGAGNGMKLLMLVKGWDFRQCRDEIEKVIGNARRQAIEEPMTDEECRAAIQKRWRSGTAVDYDSAVSRYMRRRGLSGLLMPKTIRAAKDRPAMLAIMQAPNGRASMLHTTLLTEEGGKAPGDKVRLFMKGTIERGSAVRLAEHGDVLGIAEGIETAWSATLLTGVPCWAALNEGLLASWEPPAGLVRVVVFGDNDTNFVGQAAAYTLAKRLKVRREPVPQVEVMIPVTDGHDWNDVLMKKSVN